MKACTKMVKRKIFVFWGILLLLIPLFAMADVDRFCDEIPPSVRELEAQLNPDGVFIDCILIEDTSLGDYCLVMSPWGMNGYLLKDDGWQNWAQVSPVSQSSSSHPFFRRHSAGNASPLGALGQTFADDLGFDIIRNDADSAESDFELLQYHWFEDEFRMVGWHKPGTGQFAIRQDGQWAFYDSGAGAYLGSVRIDRLYEDGLAARYDDLPATLEAAKKMEAITQPCAESLFPGWTMCSYGDYNGGHGAEVGYYRLENGMLTIRRVVLHSEKGLVYQADTMPVPISAKLLERFQAEEADTLIDTSGFADSFLTEDSFDRNPIPVSETVLQNDMQSHGLLLLTEDGNGARHIRWVEQEGDGYAVRVSQALPADTFIDLFHGGDDEISLEWNMQRVQCAFGRMADGNWSLGWVMSSGDSGSETISMIYCGVITGDYMNAIENISVGSHSWRDLFTADLTQLPTNAKDAAAGLDRNGWAVVCNPDSTERLHLRLDPDRSSASLGKFYNCTPVQVLEQKGDWSRVRIGLDGHLEGWMMTRYLAFDSAMDDVVTAAPNNKTVREEYADRPMFASASMKETASVLMGTYYWIIGVVEDELYILLDADGNTGYLPQSWFWEGNG